MLRPVLVLSLASILACSEAKTPAMKGEATQMVFDTVSPSVVAILNDDRAQREVEVRLAMRDLGQQERVPKTVVDVSLRKEPMPHGTGFVVDGGLVLTAAHVIRSPDELMLTTKAGQTVPAELVHIDEVRDVALLRPRVPLTGVPPLALATTNPAPGHRVWALGHTGAGLWALAWGVSEGITSGVVDLLGAKLLLFDAPVYPGFSGGPVVTIDRETGRPVVVGVNHAILYAGGLQSSTISSASSASDIRATIARTPPALAARLAEYARAKDKEIRAGLFITKNLTVHRDPTSLTTAAIEGNERTIHVGSDDVARVPAVAMLFGLPTGEHEVTFEVEGPDEEAVDTQARRVRVAPHERVVFATADFRFEPKVSGRYHVHAKLGDKTVGHADVWIEDPDRDDEALATEATEAEDLSEPQVDVIVASGGREDPFALSGIRSGWVEWRYPRRVEFTWYARGSRGWSGTNAAISSFVLDDKGTVVGRGVGCFRPELRPAQPWQCAGDGGDPLIRAQGRYDIVFTINERPIAMWPMEAMVRSPSGRGSSIDKWLEDLKKQNTLQKKKPR
ncbi:MAG: trypsin-like peptidase domain-containing protein [Labilithrix sp.]|nr:trypsin-like peptidase domain-containing protein [Labilithrix sp.]MCW5814849.1 trypsin-like peptidase domain-containing protein [Labilithrix sp.]